MRRFTFLVVVVLLGAACSDSSDTTTTTAAPETTTATTEPPATTEAATTTEAASKLSDDAVVEVVLAALDAKNSFDLDGWLMSYKAGERLGVPLHAEEILMNANQHWEVVEPCQVTGESAASGDTIVECVISNTDDFWGAGGIFDTRTFEFRVNADGVLTQQPLMNSFASDRRGAFNQAFSRWLSDTYPDAFAETGFLISSDGPGFVARDSTHMLVAVEYVEEFVAESDVYPLDPTNP